MPDMTNRIALVTGAASGIGLATAVALAREGADVALLSRPEDNLAGAQQLVEDHGGRVLSIGADVGDSSAVRAAFARVESELGPIDAVHNNAGISIVAPLVETTDEVLDMHIRTNLAGAFYVLREAARVMQPRRTGAIVNTASELAIVGQAGYAAYTATKGAVLALTRSAAAELASWGSSPSLTARRTRTPSSPTTSRASRCSALPTPRRSRKRSCFCFRRVPATSPEHI
jgi:NAD(P)-dependent dehydrogenase (short-subunit alcohol dehydrogenase family)